ncbi:hypothetical protein H2202_005354 [Exophiala xenobiotica]|nr:hypothetical protein H2202_005354 [Exophiala xenobiotica]
MATQFEADTTHAVNDEVVAGVAVIAVDKSGTRRYAKAFGTTSINGAKGERKPMELDTTMWLASCSKIATAVACMQCVERGLLSLDDPVTKVLPELNARRVLSGYDNEGKPILRDATKAITLRQLLTHSSGMAYPGLSPRMTKYMASIGEWPPTAGPGTKKSIVDDYAGLPLLYEPGDGWDYSPAIDWAGKMVERVNPESSTLGEYMRENIFEPLGMALTTFRPSRNPAVQERLVGPVFRAGEKLCSTPPPGFLWNDEAAVDDFGGAGLHSCAEDYIKILTSLLLDDGKLLKSETVEELFRPQLPDPRYMQTVMDTPEEAAFLAPSFGTSVKWNHALGGAVALDGVPGRADAAMMYWAGMPNSYWWIDRARGVCGVFADQIFPPADPPTQKLFAQFQRDIYKIVGDA